MRSLMALRQILELGCGALVIPEQVSVANAADAFDDMDNLKDEAPPRPQGAGPPPYGRGDARGGARRLKRCRLSRASV